MERNTLNLLDNVEQDFRTKHSGAATPRRSGGMICFTLNSASGVGVLTLEGVLDRRIVAALDAALFVSLGSASHVVLDVQKVRFIGNSCLSVFCKAHRAAFVQKKQLSVVHGDSRLVATERNPVTENSRGAGCVQADGGQCLWTPSPDQAPADTAPSHPCASTVMPRPSSQPDPELHEANKREVPDGDEPIVTRVKRRLRALFPITTSNQQRR